MTTRSGLSPLIASVLLIAFVIALAAIAGPWFVRTIQQAQTGTSEDLERVSTAADLGLEIHQASYNRTTSNLTVAVENTGSQPATGLAIILYGDQLYQRVFNRKLGSREVETFEVEAGDHWDLKKVEASLTNYSVAAEAELDGRPSENSVRAYWRFDEGSGDWANSTNQMNGLLKNASETCNSGGCPTWITGVYDNALDFDGRRDYVDVRKNGEFFAKMDEFTVSFWAKWDNPGDNEWHYVLNFNNGRGGDDEIALADHRGSREIIFYIYSGGSLIGDKCVSKNPIIEAGEWDHYTWVWKQGEQRLYQNGVEVALEENSNNDGDSDNNCDFEGSWSGNTESNKWIGRMPYSDNEHFNGSIDELRIWNTALTDEQIRDTVGLK